MKKINIKMKILVTIVIIFAMSLCFYKVFAATYENLTYEIDLETKEITITGCAEGATELVIPNEIYGYKVTKIAYGAFAYNSSIENVEIPSNVKYIESSIFEECTNLRSVNIQKGITNIPTEMFYGCSNLESITIPSSVTAIGPGAFEDCTNLKNITIPSSVTDIGAYSFMGCSILNDVVLPPNLNYLGECSFKRCSSLEEIEIPMTMWRIRGWTFDECTSLKKIIIPYTIKEIESSFENISSDLIVYTMKDSYAHIYAINNDYNFEFYTNPISSCSITGITDLIYSGYNLTQNAKVKYGGYTLENGTDYTVDYTNNLNSGTASISITGKYAFSGTITKQFNIRPENLSNCTISNIKNQTYTGNKIYPSITIKNKNMTLVNGIDYTVSYINNTEIGTATVEITGKGNYTGTVRKNFNIIPRDISKCIVSSISNQLYTGKTIKPSITVKEGNKTLKNGADYNIGYSNNKKVGTATLTISGKGIYSNTKTIKFKIVQPTSLKIKSKSTDSIKLSWKKANGASGYEIYSYNYSKKKWNYVKKVTSSTYTIKKLKIGSKYKYRIRAYKNENGKKQYGAYTSSVKTTLKLSNTNITSITTKSKKANLKWKKVSGASGYEVYMATRRNGKYTKVTTTSSVKYTKKNLRKNKTYYFKIRTYKKVNGKKKYSSYSSIKSIRIR